MARTTRDLCQDCWQDVHPDQYAPVATRFETCDRCHAVALVTRSILDQESTPDVLRSGDRVLLIYPEGDCDMVTIVELALAAVTVRLPSGKLLATVVEDIGIGVDDDLQAIFDDGSRWPPVGNPGEGFTITSPDGTKRIGSAREYGR